MGSVELNSSPPSLEKKSQNGSRKGIISDTEHALPLVMKGNLSPEEVALLEKFRTDKSFATKVRGDIQETNGVGKIKIGQRLSKETFPEINIFSSDREHFVRDITELNFFGRKILAIVIDNESYTVYRDSRTGKPVEVFPGRYLAPGQDKNPTTQKNIGGKNILHTFVSTDLSSGLRKNIGVFLYPSGEEMKILVKGATEYMTDVLGMPGYENELFIVTTDTKKQILVNAKTLEPIRLNGKRIESFSDIIIGIDGPTGKAISGLISIGGGLTSEFQILDGNHFELISK